MDKKNINLFNLNFFCKNEKSIIDIYTKNIDIILFNIFSSKHFSYNNQVVFKREKYNHPLFLNYNYCLFCHDKIRTKYYKKNLINTHKKDISLFDFMENHNIKLKKQKDKKKRITRRFIKSFDKSENNLDSNFNSDTEIFIECYNKKNINISYSKNNDTLKSFKTNDFSSISNENNSKSNDINIDEDLNMNINIDEEKLKRKFKKLNSYGINKDKLYSKFRKGRKSIIKKDFLKGLNKSSDNLIIEENDKSNSNVNYFSIIKNYASNKFLNKLKKSTRQRKISENKKDINNQIKNDFCSICLGEIKNKCILTCGDYFCKDCMIERIKNILKNVAEFDKMKCPLCNEPIEEKTLKRLLTEKEFDFYEKIKMRIEGLKNKNLIPCPYPDCEGFADKNNIQKKSIFVCQNNHYFCGKCIEVVEFNDIHPKFRHLCRNKYPETMKYLKSKKNRKIIKKCPNCNCWVQKEQYNCNNVKCTNIWCNYEFCWICKSQYDESHYKNPFSMCFGLSAIDPENYFTKHKRMRLIRCMIIVLILVFVILPFFVILFSYVIILVLVFGFFIDATGFRNVKFKTRFARKMFYNIFLLYCFMISIILIPLGHLSFILLIFLMPIYFLIKKLRRQDDFD